MPLLSWTYVSKKNKSRCSCLARLWDCVVLVNAMTKVQLGGFMIQPVSGRSNSDYGFGLLLCLFCFSTHWKRMRSVTALFSCPTPLLSVFSPFYLDSKLWTTCCFFVAVTYCTSHQVGEKPSFIFAFFKGLLPMPPNFFGEVRIPCKHQIKPPVVDENGSCLCRKSVVTCC